MVANIDDTIRSLNRHIAILEAKTLYLIISSSSSSPNDNGDRELGADSPYRREIKAIEDEMVYTWRRKLNFERLRQMGATKY